MAKHLRYELTEDGFTFERNRASIEKEVGPIRHRLEERVRAHAFLCMLARYVRWRME